VYHWHGSSQRSCLASSAYSLGAFYRASPTAEGSPFGMTDFALPTSFLDAAAMYPTTGPSSQSFSDVGRVSVDSHPIPSMNWTQYAVDAQIPTSPLPVWYDSVLEVQPVTNPYHNLQLPTYRQTPATPWCAQDAVYTDSTSTSSPYMEPYMDDGPSSQSDRVDFLDYDDERKTNNISTRAVREPSSSSSVSRYSDPLAGSRPEPWSITMGKVAQSEPRIHACPMSGEKDAHGRVCKQRFARPEHSRRHVQTVHSSVRPYCCKVPQCAGAFSRKDNLRQHYWTHLERGGRIGKNNKMSLEELRVILGPKERKLLTWLRVTLARDQKKRYGFVVHGVRIPY
jgi:hypothetical protein